MLLPSNNCTNFIKREEECVLHSYQDEAGIWTIGWGSIKYRTGKAVGPKEAITQAVADDLLAWEINTKAKVVAALTANCKLNQNQFDSLVSFTYNCGVGALQKSTLLKTIIKNPEDPFIRNCFMMWNKVTENGKLVPSAGLSARRKREADLYFTT